MSDLRPVSGADSGVRRGLFVSAASLAWTLCAGAAAIAIGVMADSLVLVAFGLIGLMDAVGSGSLIVHFRHALRHAGLSERHERLALRLVTMGMIVVGVGTVGMSCYRLAAHARTERQVAGVVLAGASVVVLLILAVRKRRIARLIPSHALHADGWLSAMGSLLALLTLAGTAADQAFGWWWSDPVAAICIGFAAIALGLVLTRGPDLRTSS